jgi:hypothetical protein
MIWWRPTYQLPSYDCWAKDLPFRVSGKYGQSLVSKFFLIKGFPEPFNDRDNLKW